MLSTGFSEKPEFFFNFIADLNKYIIPTFRQTHLTVLKSDQIKSLCDKQKAKRHSRTVQYIYSMFIKSVNDAVKLGILVRNPVDGVPKPKVERHQFKTLSEEDLNKFLETIQNSEYYPLFFTDLFTVFRRSELLALR
jgi:integrase